jgi:hypothetical protein
MDWMEEFAKGSGAHTGKLTEEALIIGAKDSTSREGFWAFQPIAERALAMADQHNLDRKITHTAMYDGPGGGPLYAAVIIYR